MRSKNILVFDDNKLLFKSYLSNYLLDEVNHYSENLMLKNSKQLSKIKIILELPIDKYIQINGEYAHKYEYFSSETEILLAYCFEEIFDFKILPILNCISVIEKVHKSN